MKNNFIVVDTDSSLIKNYSFELAGSSSFVNLFSDIRTHLSRSDEFLYYGSSENFDKNRQIAQYTSFIPQIAQKAAPYVKDKDVYSYRIDLDKIPLIDTISCICTHTYDIDDVDEYVANSFNSTFDNQSSLFPIAVRYITSNGTLIVERPPFKINVDMKLSPASKQGKRLNNYQIWVPWTLTAYHPSEPNHCSIYFGSGPLESMDSIYLQCPLPNTYGDGAICFSNSLGNIPMDHSRDTRYLYSLIINEYYSGGWNLDLSFPILDKIENAARKANKQDYPLVFRLLYNPTFNDISQHLPSFSTEKVDALQKSYYKSYHSKIDYIFNILSTFTLEQTIDLYSFLSVHNSFSFDRIVSKFSGYRYENKNTPINIPVAKQLDYSAKHLLNHVVVLADKSQLISKEPLTNDPNFFYDLIVTDPFVALNYFRGNILFDNMPELSPRDTQLKQILEAIQSEIIVNQYSSRVYFINYVTGEYESHDVSDYSSIEEFYYNFIYDYCSIPLEESNSQNASI